MLQRFIECGALFRCKLVRLDLKALPEVFYRFTFAQTRQRRGNPVCTETADFRGTRRFQRACVFRDDFVTVRDNCLQSVGITDHFVCVKPRARRNLFYLRQPQKRQDIDVKPTQIKLVPAH